MSEFHFLKSVVWLYHILSIHLFVCGLGCFFFNYYTLIIHWVVMNNDVMNTGVQILFKSLLSGLFGYIPSVELLDHMVILWLKFLRNLHTVFYKGHTILHSHQQHMSLWLLFFLPFPFPSSSISPFPPHFHLSQLKLTSYSPLNLGSWITLLVQLSDKLFLKMVRKVRWTPDSEKRVKSVHTYYDFMCPGT